MTTWKLYRVVFKIRSPIHVGYRKYRNLMQTRPYVPARTILGALTSNLTRTIFGPTTDGRLYRVVGETLNEYTRFTYLYPALKENKENSGFKAHFPWEKPEEFYHRFIGSYVSTSLQSGVKAAEEGSLHEAEFISPKTMDDNKQVYLLGYVFTRACDGTCDVAKFVKEAAVRIMESQEALQSYHDAPNRISDHMRTLLNDPQQLKEHLSTVALGGERGYGWGKVECVALEEYKGEKLYDKYPYDLEGKGPTLTVPEKSHLPAHAIASPKLPVEGPVEPLVRREWKGSVGSSVVFDGVAYEPGGKVLERLRFKIKTLGYLD
ncbi:MAG: hypothetical protein GXO39_01870 [Thermotogae bacterium]|nr:hypothetical protein [Thermotogota bacterium]